MAICKCGCGNKIQIKKWHEYEPVEFISGHNRTLQNPLLLMDKTLDKRKNQKGYLAPKIVSTIKRDAIKAGYEWKLDAVFVFNLIISDCVYCGAISNWPHGRNGIDRINSSIGYDKTNCVSCCKYCNRAKSDRTTDEFKSWAKRLYSNFLKDDGR